MNDAAVRLYNAGLETVWVQNVVYKPHLEYLAFTVWYPGTVRFVNWIRRRSPSRLNLLEDQVTMGLCNATDFILLPDNLAFVGIHPMSTYSGRWPLIQVRKAETIPPFRALRFSYSGPNDLVLHRKGENER